jgi:hypothetical protein
MKDKSLAIWLMVIFGVSGLSIIVLSWLLPALQSDRASANIVGLAGIAVATVRGLMLRKDQGRPVEELIPDIGAEKKK